MAAKTNGRWSGIGTGAVCPDDRGSGTSRLHLCYDYRWGDDAAGNQIRAAPVVDDDVAGVEVIVVKPPFPPVVVIVVGPGVGSQTTLDT